MARTSRDQDRELEYSKPARPRRSRLSWFSRFLLLGTLLSLTLLILAPTLLSSASIANWAIARFAGLSPLQATVGELKLGWLTPISVRDIRLLDANGQLLALVQSVNTEKSLTGWITQPKELGTLRVDQVEAQVVVSNGTSNIEQALSQLLSESTSTANSDQRATSLPSGKVEISNVKLNLSEEGRAERWVVEIAQLHSQLPTGDQLFGPTQLQARITETSGSTIGGVGEITADAQQADDGSVNLRAKLSDLPLELVHLIRARLPDLPVEAAMGRVSGWLSGSAVSAENFAFDLQQIQGQNLALHATALVGPSPVQLKGLQLSGKVNLANNLLRLESSQLACDFAQVQANAELSWPIEMPSLQKPIVPGATIQAAGQVDLPRLIIAAQSLIPMQPDTQLHSGNLQFQFQQQSGATPSVKATAVLTSLEAVASGQTLKWAEPLTVELSATAASPTPQFGALLAAEFCKISGGGTIENGTLDGTVNLDLLANRLSQFVQLPVASMSGNAQLQMNWKMDANQLVTASGTLATSPIAIATPNGSRMNEPAWQGRFNALAQLDQGKPTSIQQLHLEMLAADEQLQVDLHEPLALLTTETNSTASAKSNPASFSLSLNGNLKNCKHRAWAWVSQPPDMDLDGNLKLSLSGKLDMQHVELYQANWDVQPVRLRYSQIALAEPQIVGKFAGRVDSNDLTKVQVEQLSVQSSSFSLLAKDQAAEQNARQGQASFFVDLNRLLKNVDTAASSVTAAGNKIAANSLTTTAYAANGQVQGGLAWLVSAAGAEFRVQANGKDIVATSQAAGTMAPTALWSESQLTAAADGRWQASDNSVQVDLLKLQTAWLNFIGKMMYSPTNQESQLRMSGQAEYDAQQLSAKIGPMTGNHLQMMGRHTMPVEVVWQQPKDAQSSALVGLQASSRIGWEQARVIGIELGRADVPVTIQSGVLSTAAEIPVSGGKLRWDIVGDLTQPLLVIEQKPMTILENVAITREMCSGWLKYVAPLVAEATSIDGRLSLQINRAILTPTDLSKQTVEGVLVMHQAEVGPGPLSNEVIGIVKQIEALRKPELTQAVSSQNRVWLNLPQQQIEFSMVEGRVHHRNVRVDIGDATITTAGAVGVDGQLELLASMPIPDKWTEKGLVLTALRGQSLQFPVRGNISKPQVDATALRGLGRRTVENAAQNLLQQQLNKGLEKLLK